jgi:hypothetical protein
MDSELYNHIVFLINKAYESDFYLKAAKHKTNTFLYNYQTNEVTWWDKVEKELIKEKTIIYRYKQLIVSSRSHTGNFASGMIQYKEYLEDSFKNMWIVTYNAEKGIIRILDYVNYGIRMNMNESIRGHLISMGSIPTYIIDEIYELVDRNNLFDSKFDPQFFVIINDTTYLEDSLVNYVTKLLKDQGIPYEKVYQYGRSFLITNEDDYNFFNLSIPAEYVKFKMSIPDFRTNFIEKMLSTFNKDMLDDLKLRYQHAVIKI